ncbi:MAG: YbaN family protein [Hyphomicrobiaceae bacterium]|nr:YbaN family protein [Hyphomicrobiaceae bacterium]
MRIAWLALGVGAMGCGIAGIVLPLVPTTPFLLVAAYAFAQSSPTLHDWLVTHPRFGPVIADWRTHGAIDRRTKVLAVIVMVLMLLGSWMAGLGLPLLLLQAGVLAAVALFILTRPDAPARRQ